MLVDSGHILATGFPLTVRHYLIGKLISGIDPNVIVSASIRWYLPGGIL
jgi:hypothetical protein